MFYQILQHPNPILNIVSDPVTDIEGVRDLAVALLEIVKSNQALGISAIQVGISKRLIIVSHDAKNYTVMVNPELSGISTYKEDSLEMCLSYMNVVKIVRPKSCWVTYIDLEGNKHGPDLVEGKFCQVVCHEFDHCQGLGIWSHDKLS